MKHFSRDKFCILDLEFNQPSRKIFQIGACVGSLRNGEVLSTFNQYVDIRESLSPFIVNLCGITDRDFQSQCVPLLLAYTSMSDWLRPFDVVRNPITWGGSDSLSLRQHLSISGLPLDDNEFLFGRRFFDTKTIFQAYSLAKSGRIPVGGLAKSMAKVNLKFIGKKHNALDDAINTWHMFYRLQILMRG